MVTIVSARLVGGFGQCDPRRLELVFNVSVGQLDLRSFALLTVLFLHACALRGVSVPVSVPSQPCLSAKDVAEVILALQREYPAQFSGFFFHSRDKAVTNVIHKLRDKLTCSEMICEVVTNGENKRGYMLNLRLESVAPPPLGPPRAAGQAPRLGGEARPAIEGRA